MIKWYLNIFGMLLLSIRQCLPLLQVIVKHWSSNTMFAMYRSHLCIFFVYFSSWIKSSQIFLQQACNGYKGWSKKWVAKVGGGWAEQETETSSYFNNFLNRRDSLPPEVGTKGGIKKIWSFFMTLAISRSMRGSISRLMVEQVQFYIGTHYKFP